MVAEKPSIARDIFKALSQKDHQAQKGGSVVLKYQGKYFQHDANFAVSSVKGHVFQRDFPAKYQNWQNSDPLELFEVATEKKSCDNGSTVKLLKSLAKNVDIILLWLDNDREGENISFEILSVIYKAMNKCPF